MINETKLTTKEVQPQEYLTLIMFALGLGIGLYIRSVMPSFGLFWVLLVAFAGAGMSNLVVKNFNTI